MTTETPSHSPRELLRTPPTSRNDVNSGGQSDLTGRPPNVDALFFRQSRRTERVRAPFDKSPEASMKKFTEQQKLNYFQTQCKIS